MSDLLREMCVEYESGAHRSNEDAMRAALSILEKHFNDGVYVVTERAGMHERAANIGVFIAAAIRSALETKP